MDETEAFDKRLIWVRWEDGAAAYVVPGEIEIRSANPATENMQMNQSENEFD